jgi:hypothetical protein
VIIIGNKKWDRGGQRSVVHLASRHFSSRTIPSPTLRCDCTTLVTLPALKGRTDVAIYSLRSLI